MLVKASSFALVRTVARVSMPMETERHSKSLEFSMHPATSAYAPVRMKIEMNIRPSFGRRQHALRCRNVAVTGKQGHYVYTSRDDVVEEPRMSQFRAAGVVAPDHRQSVPHRVHRRLCTYIHTSVAERSRRE